MVADDRAHVAQLVEHVLGKDEVTGSNPVNSSKDKDHFEWSLFLCYRPKKLIIYSTEWKQKAIEINYK